MRKQVTGLGITLLLCALSGPVGCSTNRVNWAARVGAYTFDQAVAELGPPDKQASLTDGTRVADWILRRGGVYQVAVGPYYGYGPYCYGAAGPMFMDHYVPDYFLRLTFNPEGKLREWKKFAR